MFAVLEYGCEMIFCWGYTGGVSYQW